jgi:hypothetical protein
LSTAATMATMPLRIACGSLAQASSTSSSGASVGAAGWPDCEPNRPEGCLTGTTEWGLTSFTWPGSLSGGVEALRSCRSYSRFVKTCGTVQARWPMIAARTLGSRPGAASSFLRRLASALPAKSICSSVGGPSDSDRGARSGASSACHSSKATLKASASRGSAIPERDDGPCHGLRAP